MESKFCFVNFFTGCLLPKQHSGAVKAGVPGVLQSSSLSPYKCEQKVNNLAVTIANHNVGNSVSFNESRES